MAWARVDDQWWCHPKVLGLSLPARGLWVTALSWSTSEVGRQNGGVVPDTLVRLIAGLGDVDALALELEKVGLWVREDTGWRIHDWAEYQDMSLSEKRAAAGRKGAEKRWQTHSKPASQDLPETAQPQGKSPGERADPPDGKPVARPMAGIPTQPNPSQPVQGDLLPAVVDHPRPAASPRGRNEVWDALAGLWGEPTTEGSRKLRGKVVASLSRAGATAVEIERRVALWPLHFPEATLTETALEKHWDRLGRPPARASREQVRRAEQQLGAAARRREIEAAMEGDER